MIILRTRSDPDAGLGDDELEERELEVGVGVVLGGRLVVGAVLGASWKSLERPAVSLSDSMLVTTSRVTPAVAQPHVVAIFVPSIWNTHFTHSLSVVVMTNVVGKVEKLDRARSSVELTVVMVVWAVYVLAVVLGQPGIMVSDCGSWGKEIPCLGPVILGIQGLDHRARIARREELAGRAPYSPRLGVAASNDIGLDEGAK
jgi:hypothetical protein